MTRPRTVPLLLSLAALAGCGGPDRNVDVDFKEVPSNVILGAQGSTPPAAPVTGPADGPSLFVLPPPVSVVALPPPPFAVPDPRRTVPPPVAPPPAPVCQAADPREAPKVEAPPRITSPPSPAQYLFRTDGTFKTSGADAREGRFPSASLRTVSGGIPNAGSNGFFFNVQETLGSVTTKTDYEVITSQPLGTAFAPGIYLYRVTSRGSDGQEDIFMPSPSLPLATFPLTRGARIEARGVDATTASAMSFVSTVTGKARVDACGEPLDSWTLEITQGRFLRPEKDTDLEFSATYALGTQFGGVILRDTVAYAGTEQGSGLSRSVTSTIAQVPRPAAGPQE